MKIKKETEKPKKTPEIELLNELKKMAKLLREIRLILDSMWRERRPE